jgi:acyl dehydratase
MLLNISFFKEKIMVDKSKLGYEFPSGTMEVEKGKIAEFAMAVAQKDVPGKIKPIYTDAAAAKKAGYPGIVIPPTFPTRLIYGTGVGLEGIVKTLGIDLGKLLHAEEEYEYCGSVCAGDVLTCRIKVADMYTKARKDKSGKVMEFTVLDVEMRNQRGELVIKGRDLLVEL